MATTAQTAAAEEIAATGTSEGRNSTAAGKSYTHDDGGGGTQGTVPRGGDALWRYPSHQDLCTYVGIAQGAFAPMGKTGGGKEEDAAAAEPLLLVSVRWMMVVCQFSWGCSMSMNLGLNIAGLCAWSQRTGLIAAMLVLTLMLTLYHAGTAFFFAHVSNVTLLAAAGIVCYSMATTSSALNDGTTSSGGNAATQQQQLLLLWMWPRSISDMWIGICITIAYMSGLTFVPDCEANTSQRYSKAEGFDQRASSRLRSKHFIRRFEGYLIVGSVVAMILLLAFAEAVFATYRNQTNPVVALSLPDGPTKTLLLAVLTVGIAFCAAINTVAICNITDGSLRVQRLLDRAFAPRAAPESFSFGRRVCVRLFLFAAMQLFLVLVPFIDLVTSLSGSIGLNTMTFLIPSMLELQGYRRVIAQRRSKQQKTFSSSSSNSRRKGRSTSSTQPLSTSADTSGGEKKEDDFCVADWSNVGWGEAFREMQPCSRKVSLIVIVTVGLATLISGTYTAILQNVNRLS